MILSTTRYRPQLEQFSFQVSQQSQENDPWIESAHLCLWSIFLKYMPDFAHHVQSKSFVFLMYLCPCYNLFNGHVRYVGLIPCGVLLGPLKTASVHDHHHAEVDAGMMMMSKCQACQGLVKFIFYQTLGLSLETYSNFMF